MNFSIRNIANAQSNEFKYCLFSTIEKYNRILVELVNSSAKAFIKKKKKTNVNLLSLLLYNSVIGQCRLGISPYCSSALQQGFFFFLKKKYGIE